MLEPSEHVWLVTPATTWASPQALLAASDRRLLWLLDDAVIGRVQKLPFAAIEAARAHAAPPPPPRRDAPRAGARRPPDRIRGAAPGDRGGAGADGCAEAPLGAGRLPISAIGTTASSASAAIAHQPES